MDRVDMETDAAKRILAALDVYEHKFHAMIADHMSATTYDAVSAVMESIRDAKLVIFNRIVSEAAEFLMAHSSLMAALWDIQLARVRGTMSQSASSLPALQADHEFAIDGLRKGCEAVIARASNAKRKPPAAPTAGL